MGDNVSDFILKRMHEWGVRRVYGYPGDGINGLIGAFNRQDGLIDFIQVRHEEMAAFMACAHAKFTGEVGVCVATSGPGAIHLLNGLYDAKMDHQPVVAIVGQSARMAMGGSFQQEVDLTTLFKDVAGEFVIQPSVAPAVRTAIDRAFRIAKDQRTVTCVILPNDLQEEPYEEAPRKHGAILTGVGYLAPHIVPHDEDLRAAAAILNAGKKVAMLVGAGAAGAADEVIALADKLGAGVAKALLGKTVLPDDLPFVTGSIGLLGTKPSDVMMQECDTLLMIGTSFPYAEFLPKEGQAKAVQIDIDGRMLSLRYPVDVPLKGDAKETIQALLPLIERKEDRAWQQAIAENLEEWWKVMDARAHNDANPINPQRVFWELNKVLPDDIIMSADSGSTATWYARDIRVRRGMMGSLSGNLATMGPGVPYAIGAKFAFPHRPVIAMVGDGAMQMNGMNEMITIAKYWEEWADPRLIVLVLANHDLNMVTWEQRVMAGDPKFEASQDIPDFPYARYAESLGLVGIKVNHPDQLADAWRQAFEARRPVVLEAVTDPDVPPLPPHISFEQAKNYMFSLAKGDVNALGTIRMSFLEMVDNYLPHKNR